MRPLQLLFQSEDTLSQIVTAIRAADQQFQISVAGQSINIRSNVEDADRICKFIFGSQACVSSQENAVLDADIWTVGALASNVVYDFCQQASRLESTNHVIEPQPANYWRDDHEAEAVTRSSALTLIRHVHPFRGLTLFLPDQKVVLYVWQDSEGLYIPHFEHLITYTLRTTCWRKGFLDVHAALVFYRNRGLLLSGPKRAGKTSLGMHLLRRGGFLLGSDMGELYSSGTQLHARAMPHLCRITRETLRDTSLLARAIGSSSDTNVDYMQGPVFNGGKFEFYASALDLVFARPVHIESMRVSAIVFPKFSLGAEHHRIKPMSRATGIQRLLTGIETDRPAADWLPFAEVARREEIEEQAKRSLALTVVDAFELEFGKSDTLDWKEIDNFIDAL